MEIKLSNLTKKLLDKCRAHDEEITIFYRGTRFRINYTDIDWRGDFLVMEGDSLDPFQCNTLAEIRDWLKTVVEAKAEIAAELAAEAGEGRFHYLLTDEHNPRKAHHITINHLRQIWYNQAIDYGADFERGRGKKAVPGAPGWFDFYSPEKVYANGSHGYQKYIDEAVQRHGDAP